MLINYLLHSSQLVSMSPCVRNIKNRSTGNDTGWKIGIGDLSLGHTVESPEVLKNMPVTSLHPRPIKLNYLQVKPKHCFLVLAFFLTPHLILMSNHS